MSTKKNVMAFSGLMTLGFVFLFFFPTLLRAERFTGGKFKGYRFKNLAGRHNPCTDLAQLLARTRDESSIQNWVDSEIGLAGGFLFRNISPSGTHPGVVVASPSKNNPNYYYHWIRDASLSMEPIVALYETTKDPFLKSLLYQKLMDFARFSRMNQITKALTGLGEPKFNVDGSPFDGPWGRPQDDGPASRATTLSRFAAALIKEGKKSTVNEELFRDSRGVINDDLDYVAKNWKNQSFDPWEEVDGQHFYTLMVQRRSMIRGAELARSLGQSDLGNHYLSVAKEMEAYLDGHFEKTDRFPEGIIKVTQRYRGGLNYKDSGLDSAVVLGAIHGNSGDGFYSPSSDRVLATVERLREAFHDLYPINQRGLFGTAIGRYPEDKYTGYNSDGPANPWPLLTNAFAENHYHAAYEFKQAKKIAITDTNIRFFKHLLPDEPAMVPGNVITAENPLFGKIIDKLKFDGDSYLLRTKYHANPDGSLDEQMDREFGFQKGARHLTWSYASMVTAIQARNLLTGGGAGALVPPVHPSGFLRPRFLRKR